MYVKERPEPGDVGRLPAAPSVQQLPTLDGGHYEEADGEWARVDEPAHDSDVVSLGDVSGAELENAAGPVIPSTGMEVEMATLLPATPSPFTPWRIQNPAPNHLTDPNSIPGHPVPAQSAPPPTGPRNPYANALVSSSRRSMDAWTPQFGPASARYPRVPPNQPVAAASYADPWRRDHQRSPPPQSQASERGRGLSAANPVRAQGRGPDEDGCALLKPLIDSGATLLRCDALRPRPCTVDTDACPRTRLGSDPTPGHVLHRLNATVEVLTGSPSCCVKCGSPLRIPICSLVSDSSKKRWQEITSSNGSESRWSLKLENLG
ncbi:hypothetical protein B0H16DRAFT_1453151 [Mycena metata]|uniref:Uncharacterized protein n=1 Tax=Mycena metata TaxID=1033252 RepID=A0AAD7JQT1_9AGAR|nr:hypothetical protein B0H16DRAFT_1453151 [Mycena metata]